MEHLRSQAAANQSLLSEKLALQRQLSAIQVELETERRSAQRAHAKEGKLQAEDAKLEIQIESLQADVLRERRQKERSEREFQKAQTGWDNKQTTLESRLNTFRNKLRITKEQLKDAETELKKFQLSDNGLPGHSAICTRNDVSEKPRKRGTSQFEDDSTIGTPGNPRIMKKIKKAITLPGDKSTFSTTPFLNRASSVALESPIKPDSKDHDEDMRASDDPLNDQGEKVESASIVTNSTNETNKKSGGAIRSRKLGHARTMQIGNQSSGTFSKRNHKIITSLEKVNEREEDNENVATSVPQTKPFYTESNQARVSGENLNIKKKRKMLGPGLDKARFEDGEEATIKECQRFLEGRNVAKKKPVISLKPDSLIGITSSAAVFRAISPLKPKNKIAI